MPNPTKQGPTGGLGAAFRKFKSMRNPSDLLLNRAWNLDVPLSTLGGGGLGDLDLDVFRFLLCSAMIFWLCSFLRASFSLCASDLFARFSYSGKRIRIRNVEKCLVALSKRFH